MTECEKCGHEFDYDDPTAMKSYYVVEQRTEVTKGRNGAVAYCKGCAPFGNTKIPEKLQ